MKAGAMYVRPSHVLVRTVLSIYSFYLLRSIYFFYYRNPDLLHTHTESGGRLSASVKSSVPLGLPCCSAFLLSVPRPTSHSHTYNLYRSSTTTFLQRKFIPAPNSSTFYTHAATSSRTRARRNHSSCSSCSLYLGHGWLAQHIQPQPQIHPDLSYLNFFDSLSLFRRSKAAEQSGAHSHEESPSESVHTADVVRSR
jgi:hypothetical protein